MDGYYDRYGISDTVYVEKMAHVRCQLSVVSGKWATCAVNDCSLVVRGPEAVFRSLRSF